MDLILQMCHSGGIVLTSGGFIQKMVCSFSTGQSITHAHISVIFLRWVKWIEMVKFPIELGSHEVETGGSPSTRNWGDQARWASLGFAYEI